MAGRVKHCGPPDVTSLTLEQILAPPPGAPLLGGFVSFIYLGGLAAGAPFHGMAPPCATTTSRFRHIIPPASSKARRCSLDLLIKTLNLSLSLSLKSSLG